MPTVKAAVAAPGTQFEKINPSYRYRVFALGRVIYLDACKGRWNASEDGYRGRILTRREACRLLNQALKVDGCLIQFKNIATGQTGAVTRRAPVLA